MSGLGFGAISAVVQFGNILHESGGPAIPGVTQGSSQYLVLTSGMKGAYVGYSQVYRVRMWDITRYVGCFCGI